MNSKSPQAYAWPSIKITRGLMTVLSPRELFSALLHEIGHRKSEWRYEDYFLILLYFATLSYFLILGNISGLIAVRTLFAAIICRVQRKSEIIADLYAAEILKEIRPPQHKTYLF